VLACARPQASTVEHDGCTRHIADEVVRNGGIGRQFATGPFLATVTLCVVVAEVALS